MFVQQFFGDNAALRRFDKLLMRELVFEPADHPVTAENKDFRVIFVLINRRIRRQKRLRLHVFFGRDFDTCGGAHGYCGDVGAIATYRKGFARLVRARRDNGKPLGKPRDFGDFF